MESFIFFLRILLDRLAIGENLVFEYEFRVALFIDIVA